MRRFKRQGFTLLEALLVIGIIGIIMSIGFLSYGRFITEAKKDELNEEIISALREARKKTLARVDGFSWGVHLEEQSFTLFQAPTYDANDPDNDGRSVPNRFTITSISLAGGGVDVVFLPLNGETNTYGSFVIQHENSAVPPTAIHIYETGVVEIE